MGTNSGRGPFVIENSQFDHNQGRLWTQHPARRVRRHSGRQLPRPRHQPDHPHTLVLVFSTTNVHDNTIPTPQIGLGGGRAIGYGMTVSGARTRHRMDNTSPTKGPGGTIFVALSRLRASGPRANVQGDRQGGFDEGLRRVSRPRADARLGKHVSE